MLANAHQPRAIGGLVTIELFGMPRHKAGVAALDVPAGPLLDVLRHLERACPALGDVCLGGRLAPHYLLSLDGQAFLADLNTEAPPGSRLILLSADVGG